MGTEKVTRLVTFSDYVFDVLDDSDRGLAALREAHDLVADDDAVADAPSASAGDGLTDVAPPRSFRKDAWSRFKKNKLAVAGLVVFVLLVLDWWPLGRLPHAGPTGRAWGALVREKLPLFALAGGMAFACGSSDSTKARPLALIPTSTTRRSFTLRVRVTRPRACSRSYNSRTTGSCLRLAALQVAQKCTSTTFPFNAVKSMTLPSIPVSFRSTGRPMRPSRCPFVREA